MIKKTIIIQGGGGFIGHHLARRLKNEGHNVICVDIKTIKEASEYCDINTYCTQYICADLRNLEAVCGIIKQYKPDELFSLAADMGGAGYVFTGDNDANIMTNSVLINLNTLIAIKDFSPKTKVFYSSSACVYPAEIQTDPLNPGLKESDAYPANPDSDYGTEKLFSERLYLAYHRNHNIDVRIARYHNIFGPEGTWYGGKEKAPAAVCRKVAEAPNGGSVEIWGTGEQTRSFLYIDECVEATLKLIESDFIGPVNIGSEEMISINNLAKMVISVSGKFLTINNIPGPVGVMGRNSNNTLVREKLGWDYTQSLEDGIKKLYPWIRTNVIEIHNGN